MLSEINTIIDNGMVVIFGYCLPMQPSCKDKIFECGVFGELKTDISIMPSYSYGTYVFIGWEVEVGIRPAMVKKILYEELRYGVKINV